MAAAANYYLSANYYIFFLKRKGFFSGRSLDEGCAAETGYVCLHVAAKANMGPSEGEHYASCPSRTCSFHQTTKQHLALAEETKLKVFHPVPEQDGGRSPE